MPRLDVTLCATAMYFGLAQAQTYGYVGFLTFGQTTGNDTNGWALWRASQNPPHQNQLSFKALNLTTKIIPGADTSFGDSDSSTETWKMQLNFSGVTLEPSNRTAANWVYGLEFPEGEFPSDNTSDWRVCATVYDSLATNISHIDTTGNGDCAPYLGEECVWALGNATIRALTSGNGCVSPPAFSQLPECAHVPNVGSATTGINQRTLPPGVRYESNNTYSDFANDEFSLQNVTRQTLSPGQAFAYQNDQFDGNAASNAAGLADEARRLRLVVLHTSPSEQFIEAHRDISYSYRQGVRMVCGRADNTSNSGVRVAVTRFGGLSIVVLGSMLLSGLMAVW